jgi:hypothetical protein
MENCGGFWQGLGLTLPQLLDHLSQPRNRAIASRPSAVATASLRTTPYNGVNARRLGLPVERDLHFDADKTLSAYAEKARQHGRIVT